MQWFGWQPWCAWDDRHGPEPPMAAPRGIAPLTILDLMTSDDFWSWAANILAHRALYLQIGVALVLVCLVLGLLHICYIQAELLLGRRRGRLVDKARDHHAGDAAGRHGLGASDMDMAASLLYYKQWADLVEARVDYRIKKVEGHMSRAGRLLTNLDGRVRRLEGKSSHGQTGRAAPGQGLPSYPMMRRPGSPRPSRRGRGLVPTDVDLLAGAGSPDSTVDSPSPSPSASRTPSAEEAVAEPRLIERRSSALDVRVAGLDHYNAVMRLENIQLERGGEAEAGGRLVHADDCNERLNLGDKDLQLKYECKTWRRRGAARSDKRLETSCNDLLDPGVSAENDCSPRGVPVERKRSRSCPSSHSLTALHQTIDESQATIPGTEQTNPRSSPDATQAESDDTASVGDAGNRSARKSYENSLDRLGMKHRAGRAGSFCVPSGEFGFAGATAAALCCRQAAHGPPLHAKPGSGDTSSTQCDSGCISGESSSCAAPARRTRATTTPTELE